MPEDVNARILAHLDGAGVPYRRVLHPPTPTSEDAARARGESLWAGGKALVMKVDDRVCLFVLRAPLRADSGAIRRHFRAKKLRFLSRDELHELTGLVPGGVPPLGEPVLPLPLFLDESMREGEKVAFNAGTLTESVILSTGDYLRVAEPDGWLAFGTPAE